MDNQFTKYLSENNFRLVGPNTYRDGHFTIDFTEQSFDVLMTVTYEDGIRRLSTSANLDYGDAPESYKLLTMIVDYQKGHNAGNWLFNQLKGGKN